MPKVSVIIPIYGVEKYIEKCARSLFEQTLDDIEFIFVDDSTPDNSIGILKRTLCDYPNRQANVKIVHHQCNKGLPEARHTGILASTGDYIAHCDSDDWVSKGMYDELYNYATETKAELIFCDYLISDGSSGTYKVFKKHLKSSLQESVIRRLLVTSDLNPVWSLLSKRELYKDIVVPNGAQTEDKTYTIQLALNSKKISYYSSPLYFYRKTPNSISNTIGKEALLKRFCQSKKNIDIIISLLKQKGLFMKYYKETDALLLSLNRYLYKDISDANFCNAFKSIQVPLQRVINNKFITIKDKILCLYMKIVSSFTA